MSNYFQKFCGPHDQYFASACPHCSGEWFGTLSRVEQALVVRVSQPGVPYISCKKYIEDFRKMETVPTKREHRGGGV